MREPLIVTQAQLEMHFGRMTVVLNSAADPSAQVQIDVNWAQSPIVGGLVGRGCEFITRSRGLPVRVAPLLHVRKDIWAWIGYREEWDEERPNRKTRRFSFRSSGITVFFGRKNDVLKPQMFRAEWAGWAKWGGDEYRFQAADAGHPHWQFDALDSLPDDDAESAAVFEEFLQEADDEVREFQSPAEGVDALAIVTTQKLSRIHFASAALWWKPAPLHEHFHSPANATDVEIWTSRSLGYLRQELGRLNGT